MFRNSITYLPADVSRCGALTSPSLVHSLNHHPSSTAHSPLKEKDRRCSEISKEAHSTCWAFFMINSWNVGKRVCARTWTLDPSKGCTNFLALGQSLPPDYRCLSVSTKTLVKPTSHLSEYVCECVRERTIKWNQTQIKCIIISIAKLTLTN